MVNMDVHEAPLLQVMRAVNSGAKVVEVKVELSGCLDLRMVTDYLSRAGYKVVSLRNVGELTLLRAIKLS